MVFHDQTRECASPRPVGTRGGCGAGWGPGACPGGSSMRWGSVRQDGRTPTRTSTRPLHPPHPAPCPYRTRDAHFPIRLSNIIRTLGRKHLNGYDSPIRSSTFIRGGHSGISKNRSRSRAMLETRCINWRSAALPWLFQPSGVNCATYSYTSSQPRTSTRSKLSN